MSSPNYLSVEIMFANIKVNKTFSTHEFINIDEAAREAARWAGIGVRDRFRDCRAGIGSSHN